MADQKETIILDFQVEQGSAIKELEDTKKSIINLKKEQGELNKAYKQGNVTLEEYASESVRLEAILKKQQSTYNNVQKSVTGVKTQLDKLIDSNKSISKEFANTASKINVAGVSIGDLTTKISSFANPATAAVGIVTALGAAYARSTIGAKDLEFASNSLASATLILSNRFASLFNTSGGPDGAGPAAFFAEFTNFTIGLLTFQNDLAEKASNNAMIAERLDDLARDEVVVRAKVNELLADNQESMTMIQDSQTEYNKKLELAEGITKNLKESEAALVREKNKQIVNLRIALELDSENEEKQAALNNKIAERSSITKEYARKLSGIEKLVSNIKDAEVKNTEQKEKQDKALANQLKNQREIDAYEKSEFERRKRAADLDRGFELEKRKTRIEKVKTGDGVQKDDPKFDSGVKFELKDREKLFNRFRTLEEKKRDQIAKTSEFEKEQLQDRIEFAATFIDQASSLFEENTVAYKVLATADAVVNTYKAANLALGSYPPPASFALAAVSIATGLANVAKINGGFAEGGFTGHGGKYQPAGVVHRGEVVWSQADVAMAGGPSRVDSMRPTYPKRSKHTGYADGGVVVNDATKSTNQSMILANTLKMMPKPVVSWAEGKNVRDKVDFKERVTRL